MAKEDVEIVDTGLYDLHQVSQLLNVKIRQLRHWISQGSLPAKKVGRKWYVPGKVLKEFLEIE